MKNTIGCLFCLTLIVLGQYVHPPTLRAEVNESSRIRELLKAEPELILDVLRDHPLELVEILEQAVLAKREHDRRVQEQADLATLREPKISSDRPIRGNPDASITIVEYSDFLCPYCSTATATVKELMTGHEGSVRLIFKHLPLNPISRELALAFEALALQDQEAAWALHDMLFERQGDVRMDFERIVSDFVQESGADVERFSEDRKRPEIAAMVEEDMEEARRFGFNGTPMFVINGIAVRGAVPLQEFQRIIEQAASITRVPEVQSQ